MNPLFIERNKNVSGELMETLDDRGIFVPVTKKNVNGGMNDDRQQFSFQSSANPLSSKPNVPSAHQSRMKYYRSLQKISEKKHHTQPTPSTHPQMNRSPKSDRREERSTNAGIDDQEFRRLSDPQYYRSEPIAIPNQSSSYVSSHRFRSALHPRLVVDSSASFVLPAPSYIPTPQRQSFLPFNKAIDDEHQQREITRKKLSKKYSLEDKLSMNKSGDDGSQEEDDPGGFAFEMEL